MPVGAYGYDLDFVMCIDGTGSMAPYMSGVKNTIKLFLREVVNVFEEAGRPAKKVRVKGIVFRDFAVHGKKAVEQTKFFVFPEEADAFIAFLDGIEAKGESPLLGANGLEAIAFAIKSDWTAEAEYRRLFTCVFTDTYAYPLQKRANCSGYPEGMPADLGELGRWWHCGIESSKAYHPWKGLLYVFAPNTEPWTDLVPWDRYWHTPSIAGADLSEMDISLIFSEFFS